MGGPRRTTTRRAILSYDQYKSLYKSINIVLPDLLVKDYQGILQDFIANADGIENLENSHYQNSSSQMQWLQQQINGLPEFTTDTTGFTTDITLITTDKVIA